MMDLTNLISYTYIKTIWINITIDHYNLDYTTSLIYNYSCLYQVKVSRIVNLVLYYLDRKEQAIPDLTALHKLLIIYVLKSGE